MTSRTFSLVEGRVHAVYRLGLDTYSIPLPQAVSDLVLELAAAHPGLSLQEVTEAVLGGLEREWRAVEDEALWEAVTGEFARRGGCFTNGGAVDSPVVSDPAPTLLGRGRGQPERTRST